MRFLVLGAGRMGFAVVYDLLRNKDIKQIMVVDAEQRALDRLQQELRDERIVPVRADVGDAEDLGYVISGIDAIISCATYKYNYELAKAAMDAGAHFLDLGGNEDIVRREFLLDEMARDRGIAIVPDCGLAPGMVSILAGSACEELDEITEIKLRAGGIPVEPRPPLNYSLYFSVEGLINEYVEDATVIRNGKLMRVPSLQDIEDIDFPPPFGTLEAFNTAGGISTLPTTYGDRVVTLDYKTIRYPGHCEMVSMLKELGLMETKPLKITNMQVRPRAILAQLLEQRLPKNEPDVVLVRVSVAGNKSGEPTEIIWQAIDYMDEGAGISAMARNTAFPVSIVAQMIVSGEIRARGTLTLETCVPGSRFVSEMQARGVHINRSERKLLVPQP